MITITKNVLVKQAREKDKKNKTRRVENWLCGFYYPLQGFTFSTRQCCIHIKAGSWRSSLASMQGFTSYFHFFKSHDMTRKQCLLFKLSSKSKKFAVPIFSGTVQLGTVLVLSQNIGQANNSTCF